MEDLVLEMHTVKLMSEMMSRISFRITMGQGKG